MSSPFNVKSTYSFEVYPAALLGSAFQNVTILGIVDFETALAWVDVAALHIQVYPHLPNGTPNDPAATEYVRILTASGVKTVLGMSWIDQSTIEAVTAQTGVFTVEGITASDITRIVQAIVQTGYSNVSSRLS